MINQKSEGGAVNINLYSSTIAIIRSSDSIHKEDCISYILFLYELVIRQKTNMVYCNNEYASKMIKIPIKRIKYAKQLARELNLIGNNTVNGINNRCYVPVLYKTDVDIDNKKEELDYSVVPNQHYTYSNPNFYMEKCGAILAPPRGGHFGTPILIQSINSYSYIPSYTFVYDHHRCADDHTREEKSMIRKFKLKNPVIQKSENPDSKISLNIFPILKKKNILSRPIPKIFKKATLRKRAILQPSTLPEVNPHKKEIVPKAHYAYKQIDHQLYNALVELGARRHREGTKTYFKCMDFIHCLLNPNISNPFSHMRTIDEKYRFKNWTYQEVLDTWKYQRRTSDEFKILKFPTIIYFIAYERFGKYQSFSPLCILYEKMLNDCDILLDSDAKTLNQELSRLGLGEDVDERLIGKSLRLLGIYVNGYKIPPTLNHIYFGKPVFAFSEFIEKQSKHVKFKAGFIQSEAFIKRFVDEYHKKGVLVNV